MSRDRRLPGRTRARRVTPARPRADARSAAASAAGRDRGVVEPGSQGLGRIRLVPAPGGQGSRGDADVRWSRVKVARARIASGYYEHGEVREQLLDAILDELTDR